MEISNIRFCQKGDEDKLYDLALAAYEDNGLFPVNKDKVRHFVECATGAIKTDKGEKYPIFVGVIEIPDTKNFAASVALEYVCNWYSDVWYLADKWNFVRTEYRKSSYGRDLLTFAKYISDLANCPLGMGIMTEKRLESKMKLYERKFTQMGAFFMYNYKGVIYG
jgi:hypothetical protein